MSAIPPTPATPDAALCWSDIAADFFFSEQLREKVYSKVNGYADQKFQDVYGFFIEVSGLPEEPGAIEERISVLELAQTMTTENTPKGTGSGIRTRWENYITEPFVSTLTVTDSETYLISRIARFGLLTLLNIVLISCNTVLIPVYIIEHAMTEISKIFTAAFSEEARKEKLIVLRFTRQIPESLVGILTSPIVGLCIGISGLIVDLEKTTNAFASLEIKKSFQDTLAAAKACF